MKYLLSKQLRVLVLILIPLLVSFACLPGSVPTGDPASEAVAEQAEVTIEADVVFGSGPFNFPDTRAGLADLSNYKATLILSFDGTRDGHPSQWSKIYVMHSTKEPATLQLTIEKTGDLINLDPVFMAEMDGAAYERRGENTCIATIIEEGNSLSERLEPAGLLNFVIGADEAGVETLNDTASDKYTFDERAFGQLGLAQSTGEMWVATEEGYILKYLLTTKGDAKYFGEGSEGTLTWDYELTDVNQPATFVLPDDCPAGMVDAPLLPDAADVVNMPGLLTYSTATSLAEAAAFYQEQIPALGWESLGEPTMDETTALMEFTQGNQRLTVVITVESDVATVTILLGKAQE